MKRRAMILDKFKALDPDATGFFHFILLFISFFFHSFIHHSSIIHPIIHQIIHPIFTSHHNLFSLSGLIDKGQWSEVMVEATDLLVRWSALIDVLVPPECISNDDGRIFYVQFLNSLNRQHRTRRSSSKVFFLFF